ncbi:MAG: CpaF/VirB11 family protein, partial [Oscillospiraceae bacterium]
SREQIFEQDGFEELNINSWNDVDIILNGKKYKTDFRFLNPEQAEDIHLKMFRKTQTPFDNAMPRAIADIGDNIRICAERCPIVDKDVAIASSIRKVRAGFVSKEELLSWGTATAEMIDFLLLCLRYGVSICVSGETGSGKTTLSGALIAIISQNLRTITIEEGSREWQFRQQDDNNTGFKNSVVHLKTRPSENENQNITQEVLVKDALRLDPDFLPIGEIRGAESFEVMGASNTGHTVITTIHSNGTTDTPLRLITLAKKAYDMSDSTLLSMAVQAFPILVHIEKCPDNVRRITEISEVLDYDGNVIHQNMLYEFETTDTSYENDGITVAETKGNFVRSGNLSRKLQKRLLKKGTPRMEILKYGGEQ